MFNKFVTSSLLKFWEMFYFSPLPRGLIRVYKFGTVFVMLKMKMMMMMTVTTTDIDKSGFHLSK